MFLAVAPDGRKREIQTTLGQIQINGMASRVFYAGSDKDNIARDFHGGRFPRVTFERAICDWIYFTRRWRMLCPEPGDIDLDGVSVPRMRRIADAMGIRRRFECWYERWLVVQADEECVGQYSKLLGY